ncbi:MAG: hypothetical protein R6V60_10450 [Desulfobacterales bacterium]|jgi:hypothetical protein
MDMEALMMMERIEEVTSLCERNSPGYENVSNFSIALYVLGCYDGQGLMSAPDVDDYDAADYLKEWFTEVQESDISPGYSIRKIKERYLVVLGDPLFPKHFAVVVDMTAERPYFSKLRFLGSGYDKLDELIVEFMYDDLQDNSVRYYKLD